METLTLTLNTDQSEILEAVIAELNVSSIKFTQEPKISRGGEIIGYEFSFEEMSAKLIFSLGSLFGKESIKRILHLS